MSASVEARKEGRAASIRHMSPTNTQPKPRSWCASAGQSPMQASYIAAVPPADVEMTDAEKGVAKAHMEMIECTSYCRSRAILQEVEIKFPQLSKPYAPELEARTPRCFLTFGEWFRA